MNIDVKRQIVLTVADGDMSEEEYQRLISVLEDNGFVVNGESFSSDYLDLDKDRRFINYLEDPPKYHTFRPDNYKKYFEESIIPKEDIEKTIRKRSFDRPWLKERYYDKPWMIEPWIKP